MLNISCIYYAHFYAGIIRASLHHWAPEAARTTAGVFTVMAHTHTLNSLVKVFAAKTYVEPKLELEKRVGKVCSAVLYISFDGTGP